MRWIFAYGSLIFRPSFEYAARSPARLRGYARRFYQGSTDHRGVPGAPGRVVTLVPQAGATCLGVAYGIDPARAPEAVAHLDVREQGGYARREVRLELAGGDAPIEAVVYVAEAGNPEWLGAASDDAIAEQIARSRGPSGDNAHYLFALADSLRALGVAADDDAHVFDLEARVRVLLADAAQ